jgi:hypothetical protein
MDVYIPVPNLSFSLFSTLYANLVQRYSYIILLISFSYAFYAEI